MEIEPLVAIVLLNWNTWEVTRDCLHSLQQVDYRNFDTILVDNASTDGSADTLAAYFPDVTILRNTSNLGFAGGSNVGIRYALQRGAEYILLLNNDTIVSPSFLAEMVEIAGRDSQVGFVGPTIYYHDLPDRIWYAGGDFSPWRGFARHHGQNKHPSGEILQTRKVTFVSGCALLMRSNVVEEVGLLDEDLFMVCEDTDWCIRALNSGRKGMYAANAVIWHKDSLTVRRHVGKHLRDYYGIRNTLWLARRHVRYYHWFSFAMVLAGTLIWRTAGYFLRGEFDRVRALYRGLADGIRPRRAMQVQTMPEAQPLDVTN